MRTPDGEGQEGVRPMTDSELNGVVQESRSTGMEAKYRTPGATVRLRGVEANTAMTDGFPCDAPWSSTMDGGQLDIGGTGFGSPEDQAEINSIMPGVNKPWAR